MVSQRYISYLQVDYRMTTVLYISGISPPSMSGASLARQADVLLSRVHFQATVIFRGDTLAFPPITLLLLLSSHV